MYRRCLRIIILLIPHEDAVILEPLALGRFPTSFAASVLDLRRSLRRRLSEDDPYLLDGYKRV